MSFLSTLLGQKQWPDQTEAILRRHLTKDFQVFPLAEYPTTVKEVLKVASRLEVKFPSDFVAHLTGYCPGVYIEAKEEIWPRPKLRDVGPFWTFLYGFHTYTASSNSEDWMRLDKSAENFREVTGMNGVPILRIEGDADVYCVNKYGEIVRYRHELNEFEPVQERFFKVFENEVAALVERAELKKNKV